MDSILTSPLRDSMSLYSPDSACFSTSSPYSANLMTLGTRRNGENLGVNPFSGGTPKGIFGGGMLFASPLCSRLLGSPPYSPSTPVPSPLSESMMSPGDSTKRGRPRANMITSLMMKGSTMESAAIRCGTCNRVFPRDKSLQAHMRTHTGERPYTCDYPGCQKAFCQSGQLKTHQRLHSGEKPFICSAENCKIRFTHANRHCPDHPSSGLVRDEDNMPLPALDEQCTSPAIRSWFQRYAMQRQERTPNKFRTMLTQPGTKRSLYQDLENQYQASRRRNSSASDQQSDGEEDCMSAIEPEVKSTPFGVADLPRICEEPLLEAVEDLSVKRSRSSLEELYSKADNFQTPIKPLSVGVSVIRKAGGHSPYPLSPVIPFLSQFRTPQKVMFCAADFKTPERVSMFIRDPTVSPMKSPRKQAALALIQLAEGDQ